MKKIRKKSILFLFILSLITIGKTDEPPFIHILPSGTTLILSPSQDADFASIQLFIDKRPFEHDAMYTSYVNAFLRNLESGLSNFTGILQLYPFDFIPESPYNFQEQGYLIFKTSSIYFDQNLNSILEQFLGNIKPGKFFLYNKIQISAPLLSLLHPVATDTVEHVKKWVKGKDFRKFMNSVTLKKNMYLYISGNVNLFRIVSSALKIQNSLAEKEKVLTVKNQSNWQDKYWYLVFRLFVLDRLKVLLNDHTGGAMLRIYMPVQNGAQSIPLWVQSGHDDYPLRPDVLTKIADQFPSTFADWYQKHYVYDLSWIYDDDQKGFYRLLAYLESGNPEMPFEIKPEMDEKILKAKFDEFIQHIHLSRPGAKE